MAERHFVAVQIPVAIGRPYTYACDRPLAPGTIVAVPLGPRIVTGVVWPVESDHVDAARIREIEQVFDLPPLPDVLIRFIDWVADYTLSPCGMLKKEWVKDARKGVEAASERAREAAKEVGGRTERVADDVGEAVEETAKEVAETLAETLADEKSFGECVAELWKMKTDG